MRAASRGWALALPFVLCNVARAEPKSDSPWFVERTAQLGSPQPCADTQEGCYSNYVVLADLDGDADLDIVFASGGGYYEPGEAETMAVYLNDGKAHFREVSASATGGFKGRLRQVAVGDIDGDGDLDIVAPDGYAKQPDALFVNDGKSLPSFRNEGKERLGTSSRAGATRLGDLDGDGDLDLIITDWGDMPPESPGTAHVYRNDGKGSFSELQAAVPQDTANIGVGPIDADLFDADGDFDLDLILASRNGESLLFKNRGDATFEDANAQLPDQPGPYVYGPDSCDVDGDDDLDLWLDNGGSENLLEQLLLNDGHGKFSDRTAQVTGNEGADDNEVQCADLDDDGDFDAVVASLGANERVLTNDGKGRFVARAGAFPAVSDPTLGLDFGDLDGDGRLDAVTAQGEGGDFLNRLYLGLAAQPTDTRAPHIRAIEANPAQLEGALRVRFAVSDRSTSDVGPRLSSATLEVVGGAAVQAHFVGGDLFYAALPFAGQLVRYRICVSDAAGLRTCSDEHHAGKDPVHPDPPPPPHGAQKGCALAGGPGAGPWLPLGLTVALLRIRRRRPATRARLAPDTQVRGRIQL